MGVAVDGEVCMHLKDLPIHSLPHPPNVFKSCSVQSPAQSLDGTFGACGTSSIPSGAKSWSRVDLDRCSLNSNSAKICVLNLTFAHLQT